MSFQLKRNESVSDGIRRIVKREIETALEQLGSRGQPDEAVHEARKCLKKVRAALRLVRGELGGPVYRRENFAFRDAARPLTEVRDATMLVETLDRLIKEAKNGSGPQAPDELREALLRNHRAMNESARKDRVFATVAAALETRLARLPGWTINQDGWLAVEPGLRRVYRAGHRALATATASPTVENLHELRKQAKYLWHQFQLLEPVWSEREEGLADEAHELTSVLGDDHDLTVLRRLIASDPLAYGGHDPLKSLVTLIDRQRRALEKKVFALGRKIYKHAPKVFTSRFEGYWKAWRPEPDGTEPREAGLRAPAGPKPRLPNGGRATMRTATRGVPTSRVRAGVRRAGGAGRGPRAQGT